MPLTFTCSCGKKYSAPDEAAGKTTKCKACGASVKIPGPATARVAAAPKPATGRAPAVPAKKPAPKKEEAALDFADDRPEKAAAGDLFQGPTPDQAPPEAQALAGTAASLYGQGSGGSAAKKEQAKNQAAGLIPWAVILGVIGVIALVIKFVVLK